MEVKVFDTYVRTNDGRYLHFDVLTDGGDSAQAGQFARSWLARQGVQDAHVSQSECLFCHSEAATPGVAEAIGTQGYCIIPLQGC